MDEVAHQVHEFYATRYDEAARLSATADGMLEMVRTRELLDRHLPPPPADVLDVGGGPGAHARWLIEAGYRVHLIDSVPRHLDQARSTGCTVELGDARRLSTAGQVYDVVLLLGPLYHLQHREDRGKALTEAHRVLRPGGLIAAAAINRYSPLLENAATTNLTHPPVQSAVDTILATGWHSGKKGFTASYFHTGDELRAELDDAGFRDVTLYGVEGPAWALLKTVEHHSRTALIDSPLFTAALHAARTADHHPELLASTSHFLATGNRAP